MLKRLIFGLVIGLFVGSLAAGAAVEMGFSVADDASKSVVLYIFAALTGILTGLVAGRPIWSKGGQIEAGLKAFFGALLGAGMMFAIRMWFHPALSLGFVQPNMVGDLGTLPAAALPMIAAVLGGFYELDNTPTTDDASKKSSGKGANVVAKKKGNVRVAAASADDEQEDDAVVKKTKR